jgi:hypothetical protein
MSAYDTYNEVKFADDFTVTEDHLKLLRRAGVGWDDCEFGAPAIDCKRPYGNSDVIGDIAEIFGAETDADGEIPPEVEEAYTRLHAETAIALQIALATGEFRAGRYARSKYGIEWRRVSDGD